MFKQHYPYLKGSDWVKRISPEDRQFFVDMGNQHNNYGKLGGRKRDQLPNVIHVADLFQTSRRL